MESVAKPAHAKRGCLWYLGVAAAAAFGMLILLLAALLLSPDEPGQSLRSIPVSAQQKTYLEVVTHTYTDRRNGEGFLADYVSYNVLAVYYTKAGSWLQAPQRVLIFCGGESSNASSISIRQGLTPSGKVKFEIKRRMYLNEIYEVVEHNLKDEDYDEYTNSKLGLEVRSRYKTAKDSVLLAVFIPPAVFPEAKAKQANFDNDCRSTTDAPKPASELLNMPGRLGEALRPVP